MTTEHAIRHAHPQPGPALPLAGHPPARMSDWERAVNMLIPRYAQCVGAFRRYADECLREWGAPRSVYETMPLLLTELVTNALQHGDGDIEHRIRAGLWYADGLAHLEVTDGSPNVPVLRQAGLWDEAWTPSRCCHVQGTARQRRGVHGAHWRVHDTKLWDSADKVELRDRSGWAQAIRLVRGALPKASLLWTERPSAPTTTSTKRPSGTWLSSEDFWLTFRMTGGCGQWREARGRCGSGAARGKCTFHDAARKPRAQEARPQLTPSLLPT